MKASLLRVILAGVALLGMGCQKLNSVEPLPSTTAQEDSRATNSSPPTRGLYIALGDSITTALGAHLQGPSIDAIDPAALENKYTKSWSTGEDIVSLLKRLKSRSLARKDNVTWTGINYAISGAFISTVLQKELPQLIQSVKDQKPDQLIVSLLIGGNDLCAMTSGFNGTEQSRMEANLDTLISAIQREFPNLKTQIILVSPPEMSDLGLPAIKNAVNQFGLTCSVVRDQLAQICPRYTIWNNLQIKAELEKEIQSFDHLIDRLKSKYPQSIVTSYLNREKFVASDLAPDCFHPDEKGQQKIADRVWADIQIQLK